VPRNKRQRRKKIKQDLLATVNRYPGASAFVILNRKGRAARETQQVANVIAQKIGKPITLVGEEV